MMSSEENDFNENILSNTHQGSNSFSTSWNWEESESEVSDSASNFSFLNLPCVIDVKDSNHVQSESFKSNSYEVNLIQENEARKPITTNSQMNPTFHEAIYCPLSTLPSYQPETESLKNNSDELELGYGDEARNTAHGNEAENSVILKTERDCKFNELIHCPAVIQSPVSSDVVEIEEMNSNPASENLALTVNVTENATNSFLDQVLDNNENLIYQRFIKYKKAQNQETFFWDTICENHQIIFSDFSERISHGNGANFDSWSRERATLTPVLPGRSTCSKKICKVVKHSLKLCRWFRRNKYIRTILEGAKTSFSSFLNTLEFEVNQLFGYSKPMILTVVGEDTHVLAIKEAFCEVFPGELSITSIPVSIDNVPTLPVGYPAALKASEAKMSYTREYRLLQENSVVVSATSLLVEALPQRWQMMTMLCLEDPNLRLHLHNFTASIPIPNEYVAAVERQTAENYPLREFGFAVNIESGIEYCLDMDTKDAYEFLTGISSQSLIKSAAEVLAGMYKNYVKGSGVV
ncbi:uncharacterized protein LOC118194940 [Stegodyphus dumicola]|uniref:uncharacterized protein LOC118194940 n=1 Tax=Stegodyphus dumicola TaxID=202533 RepID=UPI0015A78691|nr:uncharacterized protein LOC118194940 [Stegodyphus dumicola]